MAKKKSKWIKANAETAKQISEARESRDRNARTGGSLRAASDGLLFAIDKTKGGARMSGKTRDALLTSVRATMTGTNIKPVQPERMRKADYKLVPSKYGIKRASVPQPKRHETTQYGFDAWGADADGMAAPTVELHTGTGQLLNLRAPPRPEPSLARAVEVIAAGGSYNPTYEAHQSLLQSALGKEMQRQAAKDRYADAKGPANVDNLDLIGTLEPGNEGATAGGEESDGDDDGEGAREGGNAETMDDRKSKTVRNKEARVRAHLAAQSEAAKAKALDKQLKRVVHIARELDAEVKAKAKAEAAKPKRIEQVLGVPKKLGKFRVRSEPWAALLSDELPDSMRRLPPTNNLLADRYLQVSKRNLMEPRMVRTKKRKYELKEYTRKGFKEADWKKL
ncbi:ribosome biogenesis protein Nop53/GLTSCR2 [Pavlovales sp. CCMP2436]|nr:ribosome biogenesis protein Nop53/GLTSCR2 [Pavlovales sp. CCMP2436]